ncbi:hypothetical protein AmDm5_1798 [Acetobacter malorum]|nr:hypothetical protein AmDm5_1798 [Acetobacter malorum]
MGCICVGHETLAGQGRKRWDGWRLWGYAPLLGLSSIQGRGRSLQDEWCVLSALSSDPASLVHLGHPT